MVSLVAVFALAILSIASVSAFGDITGFEVNGIDALTSNNLAVFAGQTIPVKVIFSASSDATDVRVKAWISGEKEYAVSTDRFDVLANKAYSRLVSVSVPSKVDPSENLVLTVLVESRDGSMSVEKEVTLAAERDSYAVELLDVSMDSEINAGTSLALDIVLKNRGRQFAEDTFVKASIPALGIEKKSYFGDLSPLDQSNPDKEDAAERMMSLNIPDNTPTGVYLVQIEAYNADSTTTVTKKVSVVNGAIDSSQFVSEGNSKTFAVGETQEYGLTLVNAGNKIRVYELASETPSDIKLSVDEPVVIVPAGASKTVTLDAVASKAGRYSFAVNIYSDGELVKKYNFGANVEAGKSTKSVAGNAAVILTVVLAVIFVVLLVVLIVLLTRKPEKAEEFGESYY